MLYRQLLDNGDWARTPWRRDYNPRVLLWLLRPLNVKAKHIWVWQAPVKPILHLKPVCLVFNY
jgi:hypothetical protein